MISALVTLLLTLFLSLNKDGTIQDITVENAPDTKPVPNVGGVGILVGVLAGWSMLLHELNLWVVLPMSALFAVSLMGDMKGLAPKKKLIAQFIAAILMILGTGLAWYWWLPVLLFIVWMTNLYTLMDGADGLAGGMAMFGFTMYGFAALRSGAVAGEAFAMTCFTAGAAAMAFLYYNFHPAKVLMGEAGSIPLGFLSATLGVLGWSQGYWPFWFPVLVFSPFIIDATATLLMHMRRGASPQQRSSGHYYQRLLESGWSHQSTVILEYILMFFSGASAIWGLSQDSAMQGNLLASWGAVYIALSMWVDKRWRNHQQESR